MIGLEWACTPIFSFLPFWAQMCQVLWFNVILHLTGLGKRVILCPSINWGAHERHQSPSYHILGMPSQGGLAEYICHPVELLVEAPSHLDFGEAAAFSLAGLTAWRALVDQGGLTETIGFW